MNKDRIKTNSTAWGKITKSTNVYVRTHPHTKGIMTFNENGTEITVSAKMAFQIYRTLKQHYETK